MTTPTTGATGPLGNITLWIPTFPETDSGTADSLKGLDDMTRPIVLQQLRATRLLDGLGPTPASFEKVAWFTHWTRVFDPEAWASLNSDVSRPFDKPKKGRIAVKVINHLGDEVMKVFRV